MTNILEQVEGGLLEMGIDGGDATAMLVAELEDWFESDACDPDAWEAWTEPDGVHFRMRLQNGEWSGERRLDLNTHQIEMC